MTKFKVGESVRCLQSYSDQFTKDKIYIVTDTDGEVINMIDDRNKPNGWNTRYFELYTKPISNQELYTLINQLKGFL
jgi:hypothetical protein